MDGGGDARCRSYERSLHARPGKFHNSFGPASFAWLAAYRKIIIMARDGPNLAPRINNRKALHDYLITAKIECGMALMGSEVKSLRLGRAHLQEAYAMIDRGELFLHKCHIEPYENATHYNHEPLRTRKLLVHKRELRRLESETAQKGSALIPLAIYFKNGVAKLELGVGQGKKQYDKRQAIRKKEQDRDLRRAMSHRQR